MKEKKEHIEDGPGFPKMETGFGVPESYFESFGERLKIRMEEVQQSSHPRGILFYLRPALGLAASLAIILTVYLHPLGFRQPALLSKTQNTTALSTEDQLDELSNTYASLVTDGQFFFALNEMDEYDASRISKDELADYLITNCSDFEILNANK